MGRAVRSEVLFGLSESRKQWYPWRGTLDHSMKLASGLTPIGRAAGGSGGTHPTGDEFGSP